MKISGWMIVLILLAAVGAAVAVYFSFFAVSDEEMIRTSLEEMRGCFYRDGLDSPLLESAGRIGDLKKHLTPEVTVEAQAWDLDGVVSNTFLTQRAFIALKNTARFELELGTVTVTLPEEKGGRAKASFTAHANYSLQGSKYKRDFPLELYFVKQKGKWLVCGLARRKIESKQTDKTEKE